MQHESVLLTEALDFLAVRADGCYIDATFGRGGHSKAILQRLGPEGQLLVIDQDPTAISVAEQQIGQDPRVRIRQGNFNNLRQWAVELDWVGKVNGILFDLGVSSPQLDDPQRGFSFQRPGPLDMRMDPNSKVDAATWLARASEQEIIKVLRDYGEERFARRIAQEIVKTRQEQLIVTTTQLAQLIAKVVPHYEVGKHPATRSFQAIRIMVNQEFTALEQVLQQSLEVLAVGGRVVVISFHSLEDTLVKRFIQHWAQGGMPMDLVVTEAQLQRRLRQVGRMIRPSDEEVQQNPRARSARCRIMEKLK